MPPHLINFPLSRSYTLSEEGVEEGGREGRGRQASISSSCYTVHTLGREEEATAREEGTVTVTVTTNSGHRDSRKYTGKSNGKSKFEMEKEAVVRIYTGRGVEDPYKGRRQAWVEEEVGRREEKEEGREYENLRFNHRTEADDETVYDQVNQLKNSVREVNEIVQNGGREGREGRYKAVLIHVRGEEEEVQDEEEEERSAMEVLYDHPRPLGHHHHLHHHHLPHHLPHPRSRSTVDLRPPRRPQGGDWGVEAANPRKTSY